MRACEWVFVSQMASRGYRSLLSGVVAEIEIAEIESS